MKVAWMILVLAAALPSAADGQYLWCENADQIYALVADSTITVHHVAAAYNCCPDGFEYAVTQQGNSIDLIETEVLSNPCLCLCCYNLSVEIEPVAPGAYTLAFHWDDYETGQWQVREIAVIVPGGDPGAVPAIAGVTTSECLHREDVNDPDQAPAPHPSTWGTIKSFYR
jgi:hypothetical protein